MPEQLNLDFQSKPKEKPQTLEGRYRDLVGVSPRVGFDDVTMLAGIADPEAERLRLKKIDDEDNKDDIKATYPRKH